MKRLTLSAALALFFLPLLQAQISPNTSIAGTIWKGTLSIPDPLECLLRFKKDTLEMIYAGETQIHSFDGNEITGHDSAVLESMTYSQHGDTVQMQKVTGGSPCNGDQKGYYLLQKTNGKLSLVKVKDPCTARVFCFQSELTQVK